MKNNLVNQDIKTDKSAFSIGNNSEPWLTIPSDGAPITFTGNADDAAKEFFDALIRERDGYITTMKADRDALAERVERLSGMLTESRHATKAAVERADALAVENAGLKAISIKLFNLGYLHGHESTVEGYFVDVHRNDIDTYHDDVVAEILEDEDETPATSAALAAIEARGVEKFADHLANSESPFASLGSARNFAIELREAK